MTKACREFIRELETVSTEIAAWAQTKISEHGWSLGDVKLALRAAAEKCGRD